MIGLALRIVALLLFVLAAVNQTILDQPPADLAVWGFAAWVAATLVDGWFGPWERPGR